MWDPSKELQIMSPGLAWSGMTKAGENMMGLTKAKSIQRVSLNYQIWICNIINYFFARYFDVQSGHPNGGSFIKANKLQGGIGLIEAVKERYGVAQGEVQIDPQNVTALQREINAPFLEMVGFDKVNKIQGNFKNLKFISLKKMGIKGLGESLTNLTEWIPNVLEMDLDDNLLTSWDKLGEICQQLPRLRMLNVSGNRMKLPSDRKAHAQALAKVSHLVLGRMSLTWPDVLCLTQDLPSLKELQCYDNLITEIPDLPEGVFQNLENLDINSNNFQHWKYVCKFSLLPNLKYLNLNAIGLKKIELPNLTEGEAYFPALKWIQLSFNEINDWQSVANLVHLKVDEVRIRNNPILETEDGNKIHFEILYITTITSIHFSPGATVRQLFIASIPTLTLFNGSELLKTERYGAELDYLKKYGREYLDIQKIEKPDSKNAAWKAFTLRHPR